MEIMQFVLEQNAEPQAMLLSLVPNHQLKFGGRSRKDLQQETEIPLTHLRPKFVSELLKLVQERHGPDCLDPKDGCVKDENVRRKILEEFDGFCGPDNSWMWFPCPRPLGVYREELLCFKLVVEIKDLCVGLEEEPEPKKRKVEETVLDAVIVKKGSKEDFEAPLFSLLGDVMGLFVEYLQSKGVFGRDMHQRVGFRAWNLVSPGLKETACPLFVGVSTSVICMQSQVSPMIEEFSWWLQEKVPAISKRILLHHSSDKHLWMHYNQESTAGGMEREESSLDVKSIPSIACNTQEQDKMVYEVMVHSSSTEEGEFKRSLDLQTMKYYAWKEVMSCSSADKLFNKTPFNMALRYVNPRL